MNNEILEKAKEIRRSLDSLPCFQEFYNLKNLIEKNEELKELRKEIAVLAKQGLLKERDNLLSVYNSHPLVNNYNICKEEIISILSEIKDLLS